MICWLAYPIRRIKSSFFFSELPDKWPLSLFCTSPSGLLLKSEVSSFSFSLSVRLSEFLSASDFTLGSSSNFLANQLPRTNPPQLSNPAGNNRLIAYPIEQTLLSELHNRLNRENKTTKPEIKTASGNILTCQGSLSLSILAKLGSAIISGLSDFSDKRDGSWISSFHPSSFWSAIYTSLCKLLISSILFLMRSLLFSKVREDRYLIILH